MHCSSLFTLIVFLLTITIANTVTKHSSRHRMAVRKRNHTKILAVRSEADAFKLLTQLGYNRCENLTDSKSNDHNGTLCQSNMELMLKKFQTAFHLPVTRKFDPATYKRMNTQRCHFLDSSSLLSNRDKLW